jgi:hypothetical protein
MSFLILGLLVMSFAISFFATATVKRVAPRVGFVDKPGHRKRGIGALAGSLVVSLIAARQGNLIRLIAPAYFIAGGCYAALAIAPTIWFAAAVVVAAHIFGSILWVSSNVLLQMKVPDEFRGRVFAAELIVMALVQSGVAYTTAVALDRGQSDPRVLAAVVGFALWIPAALWLFSAIRRTPTP